MNVKKSLIALAVSSLLLAEGATIQTAQAASGSTGQGIMVNLAPQGVLAIVNDKTYTFDNSSFDATGLDSVTVHGAGTYYTNTQTGSPTLKSSQTQGGNACTPSQPTIPAAPYALSNKVIGDPGKGNGVAWGDRCTFLNGGTLSTTSYTQDASSSTSCTFQKPNGSLGTVTRIDTYTFTYTIAPVQSVDPFTAWYLSGESNPNGTTHVIIGADIAGESVLKSTNPKIGTKYSFSLGPLGSNSTTGSRVTGLAVSADDGAPVPTDSTVNYPEDFSYTTNAGSNGNLSLQDGYARTILNNDGFAGNDDGGADGSALAIAHMDLVGFDLGAGNHSIVLTGTVKDNSVQGSDLSFSVSQQVNIITPGCGGNQ